LFKKDEFFTGKSAFSLKKMLSNDPKRIILWLLEDLQL
jgi:hypothetical protein